MGDTMEPPLLLEVQFFTLFLATVAGQHYAPIFYHHHYGLNVTAFEAFRTFLTGAAIKLSASVRSISFSSENFSVRDFLSNNMFFAYLCNMPPTVMGLALAADTGAVMGNNPFIIGATMANADRGNFKGAWRALQESTTPPAFTLPSLLLNYAVVFLSALFISPNETSSSETGKAVTIIFPNDRNASPTCSFTDMVKRVFADSDLVKWVMTASEEEVIDVLHNVHHGIQQECVWQYHFLKHECFGDDYVARIKELQSEVAMKTAAVGGMDYVFNGAHSILANKKLRPLFIVALLLISKPRLTNRCSKSKVCSATGIPFQLIPFSSQGLYNNLRAAHNSGTLDKGRVALCDYLASPASLIELLSTPSLWPRKSSRNLLFGPLSFHYVLNSFVPQLEIIRVPYGPDPNLHNFMASIRELFRLLRIKDDSHLPLIKQTVLLVHGITISDSELHAFLSRE